MQPLFTDLFFSNRFIQALSWTLIHSLWQGMLLSMLAGCIMFFTKKVRPALRYNLLTTALMLFVGVVVATFSIQISNIKHANAEAVLLTADQIGESTSLPASLVTRDTNSLAAQATSFLNEYAGWIVIAWLLVITLKCVQLTAGLYGVFQLKRKQTFFAGEYWANRVIELSEQLQINKKVQLLQSGIAKVPAVIGFFKPVILFPAGLLISLPPSEVEAILIHELAHIKRKDFLVNMVQHIIEIIFFFNPAVLWVSSLIKLERENCCDDIALGNTENKRTYINALVSFHGFDAQQAPLLSNAFGERKTHLMDRIKRIIYNNNKTLNAMEKKLLSAGMIITCVIIFAFTSGDPLEKSAVKNTVEKVTEHTIPEQNVSSIIATKDTLPKPRRGNRNIWEGTINTTLDGTEYIITTKENKITQLQVDGKKIASEKIADYKNVTDKIIDEAEQEQLQVEQSQKEIEQSKLEIEQSKLEIERAQKEVAEDMAHSKIEMEQSQKELKESMHEIEQSQKKLAEEMDVLREKMSKDVMNSREFEEAATFSLKERTELKKEMEQHNKQAKIDMEQDMRKAKLQVEQSRKEMANAKKEMELARIQMDRSKKDMEQSRRTQEQFVSDLLKENLIKDKSDLQSYKLSDEELIVNGVKQSDAMHKKFKAKYAKGKNWSMQYTN
ncbi:MAG: M56 family metallopeptidase [Ferruginibacter sp.]